MSNPDVTFPPARIDIAHVECAAGSQRDPSESLGQPCHVCGHWACRIGPTGPVPCESCQLVVYVRRIARDTSLNAIDTIGELRTAIVELNRRFDELKARVDRANAFPI